MSTHLRSQTNNRRADQAAVTKRSDWTVKQATDLYGVKRWGAGYFGIDDCGHLIIHPTRRPTRSIDLLKLVEELRLRGIQPPILLRFTDILKHRLRQLNSAFSKAITQFEFKGDYRCVYPIKVNQQRHVVEEIRNFGRSFGFGLEAGSKPELLAVMAMVDDNNTPIICNGFKDSEFIEAVILSAKIGAKIIPVVESFSELRRIVYHAERHSVRPDIGIRVKLASRGAGRWESSGGIKSKFGLSISDVMNALEHLRKAGMGDCLKLLHFHLGSQISKISNIKKGITEAGRVYSELRKAGAELEYIDVGGGLGVDYVGAKNSDNSSVNYTMEEYANDVVYYIKEACDQAGVDHPTIISESGRAVVAYHSVLVCNVLDVHNVECGNVPESMTTEQLEQMPLPVRLLWETYCDLNAQTLRENWHDAQLAWDQTLHLFNLGYCPLAYRVLAERLFFAMCRKAMHISERSGEFVDELSHLQSLLADTYFCNMSIFQSVPDLWAIDQLFPIMPIHRLDERPARRGILADITCDSDGKIDRFINGRKPKSVLELHDCDGVAEEGTPEYYIGIFLVGAYQEILGDMHNLFGDTNAVHISLGSGGEPRVEKVVEGDTVRDVLKYVQYSADELKSMMRQRVEKALRRDALSLDESRFLWQFYERGLEGYTYLE